MEKLANVVSTINLAKFKVTNDKLNQLEARTVKAAINDALESIFTDLGLETTKSDKGFLVRMPNEHEGSIVVNVDAVIKKLSFDFDQAAEAVKTKAKKKG